MKGTIFLFLLGTSILFWLFTFNSPTVKAIYNPLSVPNNKFGVHILEPSEVLEAAKLVNSNGGSWGYVTIPIRTDDRDKDKWINFMKSCRQNMIIPILRISSYASNQNWVSPPDSELTDFANFLNDLPWPVKNRYIIIYNEPNHSQEWGGYVSPSEYAFILTYAHDVFKSQSQDFFILSAGLDMSAPNTSTSMDALNYYRQMTKANKKWYQAIDGLAVHAYPNPGFTASVRAQGRFGITSYRYETSLLKSLGYPPKPLFITETGYLGNKPFYPVAFKEVWIEENIIAVTPFVLFAGAGDFVKFSLLDTNRQPLIGYKNIFSLSKNSGSPLLNDNEIKAISGLSFISEFIPKQTTLNIFQKILNIFIPLKSIIMVGSVPVRVEIVDKWNTQTRGLSGRKYLDPDSGMLFKYPDSVIRSFWMKDMNFPLDFIWINSHRVVHLDKNIPPPSDSGGRPVVLTSSVPVDMVLEVPSGFINFHGIKIGYSAVLN